MKRAKLGDDGVLRAVWWEGNDALRAAALPVRALPTSVARSSSRAPARLLTTPCVGSCVGSGLWIEGTIDVPTNGSGTLEASGLWLQINSSNHSGDSRGATSGFGLMIMAAAEGSPHLVFALGEQSQPGVRTAPTQPSGSQTIPNPLVVDRAMSLSDAGGSSPHAPQQRRPRSPLLWRAVLRNSWASEAMVEFFVDGVLSLPFTLRGAATGVFAAHGAATVTSVHRLSLPEA